MPRPKADGEWVLKQRRGRAKWYAYRRVAGKPQWLSLETEDEGEAGQNFADLETDTEHRQILTVTFLLDSYLADREGKVAAFGRLKEAIIPLKAKLGHYRPDQIDQRRWDKYAKARGVSDGTLRRERNVLVAAFNLARGRKIIERTPVIKPPPPPQSRQRFLSREEADKLLAAFNSHHARLLYTICLYTGCRKGQAIALTWDRVDFANNRIDFNEPGRAETVKRRAIVPMGKKLRAAMDAAHKIRTIDRVIEFGGEPATKVRWPFLRARERAGLGTDVTPHVLRHTAASWLAMAKVPLDEAADLLACDPKTLRRVYRKFDPRYLSRAVKALEG